MRSFSNIMPNFADKLHLLVDSIVNFWGKEKKKKTPSEPLQLEFF